MLDLLIAAGISSYILGFIAIMYLLVEILPEKITSMKNELIKFILLGIYLWIALVIFVYIILIVLK